MNVPKMTAKASPLDFAVTLFPGERKYSPVYVRRFLYEEAVELGKKDAKLFPIDSRGFPLDYR